MYRKVEPNALFQSPCNWSTVATNDEAEFK